MTRPEPDDPITPMEPMSPMSQMARNRAQPRRGTPPGRPQTGWWMTRRLLFATGAIVAVASGVLLVVLAVS